MIQEIEILNKKDRLRQFMNRLKTGNEESEKFPKPGHTAVQSKPSFLCPAKGHVWHCEVWHRGSQCSHAYLPVLYVYTTVDFMKIANIKGAKPEHNSK